jgi:hypothetical protein
MLEVQMVLKVDSQRGDGDEDWLRLMRPVCDLNMTHMIAQLGY